MTEIVGNYSFGAAGSARPFMREGWSHADRDFSWTEGTCSRVILPFTAGGGETLLELSLSPLICEPVLRRQRVIVSVNGIQVADEWLLGECALGLDLPPDAVAGADRLDVQLDCPTASVPADIMSSPDTRRLGIAVREMLVFRTTPRAPFAPRFRPPLPLAEGAVEMAVRGLTGLGLPELGARFESLGHNCEFGLVQRAIGTEMLGLLRFGGIPVPRLIEGIDWGFEGLEAPENLLTYLADASMEGDQDLHEFIVRDRRYETNYHTDMYEGRTDAATVLRNFQRNFAFLRRKLVEDMHAGHKIFVFQHPAARSAVLVRPILNLLRSYGPNTLLFVTDGRGQPPGAVVQLDEDLLQGFVRRLAPAQNVLNFELAPWISVCANAYRLWRESGRGA